MRLIVRYWFHDKHTLICVLPRHIYMWLIPIIFTVCRHLPASPLWSWSSCIRQGAFDIGFLLSEKYRESTLCCLRWMHSEVNAVPETTNLISINGTEDLKLLSVRIVLAYSLPIWKMAMVMRERERGKRKKNTQAVKLAIRPGNFSPHWKKKARIISHGDNIH